MSKPKAMISQPMRGLTEEEILNTRKEMKAWLEDRGYDVIDTFIDHDPEHHHKNHALYCLGESLKMMADCDLVVFCGDWANTRGCRIEYMAAREYGIGMLDRSGEVVDEG